MINFWQHAKNIYGLLKEAWCCDCLSSHHANLHLQYRASPEVELEVDFVFSQDSTLNEKGPWNYRRTQIKRIDSNVQPNLTTSIVVPVPAHPNKAVHNLALRPSLKTSSSMSKKGVKWEAPSLSERAHSDSAPSRHTTGIMDMCRIFAAESGCTTYGCLMGTDCQYSMHPLMGQTPQRSKVEGVVSLERLLGKGSTIRLSRRERYAIALTIASSHLQLHDSPWLGPQWSKKDVLFDRKNDTLVDNKPYISCSFCSKPTDDGSVYIVADHGMSTLGMYISLNLLLSRNICATAYH